MKKLYFLLFSVALSTVAFSQTSFWSNNGLVSVKDSAYISIIGDAYNQNDGHYNNSDTIFVTGDWIHDAPNRCFDSINTGWVYLYTADQRVRGTSETHFYNLILENQGVKYGDLDVYVDGHLVLNDREFSLDTNTVWVTNPDLDAVQRSTGYVSSLEDGGLLRRTDTVAPYLFPVGSNVGIFRYRPIEFTPVAGNINHYKARFANVDPTIEGYDRDVKFHLVCQINPNWYHRLYHQFGNDSADITIYYDTIADGQWNDIVEWKNVPQWESIFKDAYTPGAPFSSMAKYRWNNYNFPPFALAITSPPFAVAGVDTIMWRTDTIQLNAFGGTTYQWTPAFNMDCDNCPNPLVWPDSSITYFLTVGNDEGCFDYDSLRILVNDKPFALFFIPNAFTPNGDGYNDWWYIRDLERYPDNEARIINRWGDEILYEKPYSNTWKGTWNGEELPGATYYYILKVFFNGKEHEYNGPLTIVR